MIAVVTEEVKEQLVEATTVTKKAFTTYRREAEAEEHQASAEGSAVTPAADKSQEEGEMSVLITIMQPILRLMQLLCENHNRELQVSHNLLDVHVHTLLHETFKTVSWHTFIQLKILVCFDERKGHVTKCQFPYSLPTVCMNT